MQLDFIKGHMGNNVIIFLLGQQVPEGKEVEVALEILDPQSISGHEVGFLYPPTHGGDLKVKIVGLTSRAFITACGGLTQVLGKVAVETDFAGLFHLPIQEPQARIVLETDGGLAEITIEVERGKAVQVWTDMRSFVGECYDLDIASLNLEGVHALKVGKFLVLDGDEAKRVYPDVAFGIMDDKTKQILLQLQDEFKRKTSPRYLDFSLYDWKPQGSGDLRVVFPHNLRTGHVEPACGTGFVATGIGLWEMGELESRGMIKEREATFRFECGSGPVLGGSELTHLHMMSDGEKVTGAKFSHGVIEIMEQGKVTL
jgi:hypothetical protein